jgi:hypothetical protein
MRAADMVTDQMNEHSFILYEASREIKKFFAKTRQFLVSETEEPAF